MQSFAQIAHARFPGYEIQGDGSLAVVLACNRKVILVQTPLEANAIQTEKCGPGCSHAIDSDGGFHRVAKLEQPIQRRAFRLPVNWERD